MIKPLWGGTRRNGGVLRLGRDFTVQVGAPTKETNGSRGACSRPTSIIRAANLGYGFLPPASVVCVPAIFSKNPTAQTQLNPEKPTKNMVRPL